MVSRNASFHERGIAGALLGPVKWFVVCVLMLLGLILAAWIIDWIMVFKVWPEGLARLQDVLREDIVRAGQLGSWCRDSSRLSVELPNFLYAVLFKATGIHDMGVRFAEGATLSIPDTIVRRSYIENFEAIQVAMVGAQIVGVRLAILAMTLPLLFLSYCVALADGLAQRAIRGASGGRESASLYHRAKHLQVATLATVGAISVLIPFTLDSRWLWVPGSIGLGILAAVQWRYYKKHL